MYIHFVRPTLLLTYSSKWFLVEPFLYLKMLKYKKKIGFTYPKTFLVAKNLLAAFCMTSLVYYNHLLFGGGFSNSKIFLLVFSL